MSTTNNRSPGVLGKFTLTVTVGVLSFVAAIVLILLYNALPKQRPLLTYVIAAMAAAGGITSAYYLAASVREAVRSQTELSKSQEALRVQQEQAHTEMLEARASAARMLRAAELSGRWGDPAFTPARQTFSRIREELRHSQIGPEARIRLIEDAMRAEEQSGELPADGPGVRRSILFVLDFFEEVCLAVNMNTADEETVKRLWKTSIIGYWDNFEAWIKERRTNTGQPRLYIELQNRANDWRG